MLQTRSWKYRSFLKFLRFFKYISFSPIRGSFLEYYYVMMRYLDDVVDGDAPLPEGYRCPVEYIEDKIDFSRHLSKPRDAADHLMLHCFSLGEKFGQEFGEETQDILHSLLFDAKRRGTWEVFPADILQEHFHKMDIRGTIRATLKIFGDDPGQYPILEPLGVACRYQYDIEDVSTDLAAGYVNITQEEMASLGISKEELRDPSSEGVARWVQKHAKEGMELLEEHRAKVAEGRFSLLARATFPVVYGWPARKLFQKTLRAPSPIQNLTHQP
jgi:hypothetical protein